MELFRFTYDSALNSASLDIHRVFDAILTFDYPLGEREHAYRASLCADGTLLTNNTNIHTVGFELQGFT